MRYKVNIDINSSVIIDENGAFIKVGGKRRVFNVFIGDELLDPNKNNTMSTHIFFLKEEEDIQCLINMK